MKLYMFLLFSGALLAAERRDEIQKYNLARLRQESESPTFMRDIEDRQQRIGASTEVFVDYIHEHGLFTAEDEGILPDILRNLRRENYDLYENISREVMKEWHLRNSGSESSGSQEIEALRDNPSPQLNEFLLARLKHEHEVNLVHLRQQHEQAMQERRQAQRKFYISTVAALVTTLISIAQAIFLGKKEADE